MNQSVKHLHLNPVGGISGNMFVGALLDTFPALVAQLPAQLELAGFGELVRLSSSPHTDGILTGTYFAVEEIAAASPSAVLNPARSERQHTHRPWQDIKTRLQGSQLEAAVKAHAIGIFAHLAEAEAAVHGMPVKEVAFHEVGAWDSIADIVSAAYLIASLGEVSWSVSSLPTGRGLVTSAHGELPLPAPAVLKLLQGFTFHDDGRDGERVTPTGAAILRYLKPAIVMPAGNWRLQNSGTGFGSRRFAGISNVLRLQCFVSDAAEQADGVISVISFMVDDQTPEALALALAQLRMQPGVVDVIQIPAYGKKGRVVQHLEVLCGLNQQTAVVNFCLSRTSTLGLRVRQEQRVTVPRRMVVVQHEGQDYRVKLAQRPDGQLTAKAEMDDLRALDLSVGQWEAFRIALEQTALRQAIAAIEEGEFQND